MFLPGNKDQESSVIEQVGDYIIGHVSNSDSANPIIKLPSIFGIDMSVTKHVFMLWLVAIITSLIIILPVRKFLRNRDYKPSIMSNGIEAIVQFIRDSIVLPNVGSKWVNTWTPLVLTFFFYQWRTNLRADVLPQRLDRYQTQTMTQKNMRFLIKKN